MSLQKLLAESTVSIYRQDEWMDIMTVPNNRKSVFQPISNQYLVAMVDIYFIVITEGPTCMRIWAFRPQRAPFEKMSPLKWLL
jgi:hypothetical protein